MAIQDLLTVAIESTFATSVLFFSIQFALFVASNPSSRCRRRYPPTPIATPVLPSITATQADANLDAQLASMPDMTALAAGSRSYIASLPQDRC